MRQVLGDALRPGGLELTREAVELCGFPAGARLLDLGCGPGATLEYLLAQGYAAQGVEQSPIFIEEASRRGPVLYADFHRLPLPDRYADGILCECSLSLAADKAVVLRECRRTLKEGGRLIVSDLFRKNSQARAIGGCAAGAVTMDELATLMKTAGFIVLAQRDYGEALKVLAARLIWHFGSAEKISELWSAHGACRPGRDFTYALLIAGKASHD
ncbi:MAG: methyltransferase domain-containing protein [Candidatus Adiutrix sp.]|nr:methyltransferase domain-containing protein [Candidatus Adiutrix sp.]